ncbi:MAG: hypothetical protein ABI700_09350 [Chloroflexota bacterium]
MGDFIRYILTGENDLTLALVEAGLKEVDPEFALQIDQAATNSADVLHGGEIYGEVEVNGREDQVFSEDIEDLREELEDIEDEGKTRVLELLGAATTMVAFQLSEEGHEHYRHVDPFWDWLFERYPGVLQIDEEGYYSRDEQLLAMD